MRRSMVFVVALLVAIVAVSVIGCGLFSSPTTTSTTTISTTTTTTEPPASWLKVNPKGAVPSARCYQALVYDPTTGRVLMFAGFNGTDALEEMWAYDLQGNAWVRLASTSKDQPSGAVQTPAVFEPSTSKVITFDGTTWGYDVAANSWKALGPKDKLQPARKAASMVLDSGSGKVILFGGTDNHDWYSETWSYDPSANSWTNLEPAGEVPAGRSDAGMAYDPVSGKVFLFGGVGADFNCMADTWSYDPVTNVWTKLASGTAAPSARSGVGMAYDPHTKTIVLYGGIDSQLNCYDDTWALDPESGNWTQLAPVGKSPAARGRSVLVYAESADELMLFGGVAVQPDPAGGFGSQVYLNDTWVYGVNKQKGSGGTAVTTGGAGTATTGATTGTASTATTQPQD